MGPDELKADGWRFIYRGLKARFRDQRAELDALTRALSPDDIAVDVGANKGSYTWSLARATPRGKVVAFEPQPALADYLARACRAAGLKNVVVESKGVSRTSGALALIVPGLEGTSPGASFEDGVADAGPPRRLDVPTVSLDDYFRTQAGHVGAVKIDVEGHELAVLQGAASLIAAHKPAIVMECEQRHLRGTTVDEVVGAVISHGYEGHFVHRRGLRPIREFDVAEHQRQGPGRFWDHPDYANNFVFLAARRRPGA